MGANRYELGKCSHELQVARPDTAKQPENEQKTTNLLFDGADPWVIQKDGKYIHCLASTVGASNSVSIRESDTILGLKEAEIVKIWEPNPDDPEEAGIGKIWAPEHKYIEDKITGEGRWYVYMSATDERYRDKQGHRMYVLESETEDAFSPYHFKGQIKEKRDKWGIDPTTEEIFDPVSGELKRYLIWSGEDEDETKKRQHPQQNLYIAEMENPWTLKGEGVCISSPTNAWEQHEIANVNEGPQVLQKNGKTRIIGSANHSAGDDYCLFDLELAEDSDPLDPAAWTKGDLPVFCGGGGKVEHGDVKSPGHCSFVKSVDGEQDIIFYHRTKLDALHPWEREVCWQPFTFDENDRPVFGKPVSRYAKIPLPSGEDNKNKTTRYGDELSPSMTEALHHTTIFSTQFS